MNTKVPGWAAPFMDNEITREQQYRECQERGREWPATEWECEHILRTGCLSMESGRTNKSCQVSNRGRTSSAGDKGHL